MMNKSDSIKELATALNLAQARLEPAKENATNPFLKSKFADLGAVIEAARPVLKECGLSYSQFPVTLDHQIGIETILMHSSGEWLSGAAFLPMGEEKGKSLAQVAGSVITYLRRYSLAAVLGIYSDEDTDGNQAGARKPAETKLQPEAPKAAPATGAPAATPIVIVPNDPTKATKSNGKAIPGNFVVGKALKVDHAAREEWVKLKARLLDAQAFLTNTGAVNDYEIENILKGNDLTHVTTENIRTAHHILAQHWTEKQKKLVAA